MNVFCFFRAELGLRVPLHGSVYHGERHKFIPAFDVERNDSVMNGRFELGQRTHGDVFHLLIYPELDEGRTFILGIFFFEP